jgi:hypothetical protein
MQHYRSKRDEKAEPQPAPVESPAEGKAIFGVQIRKALCSTTGAEQMNDYDEQMRLWHEGKITARPIRIDSIHDKDMQISQLIRERDEARAAVTTANSVVAEWQRDMEKAERAGFERGVKEAAKVLEKDGWSFPRDAILALLEKPTPPDRSGSA